MTSRLPAKRFSSGVGVRRGRERERERESFSPPFPCALLCLRDAQFPVYAWNCG
jgi:hypothetical protein